MIIQQLLYFLNGNSRNSESSSLSPRFNLSNYHIPLGQLFIHNLLNGEFPSRSVINYVDLIYVSDQVVLERSFQCHLIVLFIRVYHHSHNTRYFVPMTFFQTRVAKYLYQRNVFLKLCNFFGNFVYQFVATWVLLWENIDQFLTISKHGFHFSFNLFRI